MLFELSKMLTSKDGELEIKYNPHRFSAAIQKLRAPKSTTMIFDSGKIVLLGTRSKVQAYVAAKLHLQNLQRIYKKKIVCNEFKIQNYVASFRFNYRIDLDLIFTTAKGTCYETQRFPGLSFSPYTGKSLCCLMFWSGKAYITGA
jgi:transcription initiation factor TFIID TATA-box-binding protein